MLAPETLDQENRTVDAQFYSGADVQRFSWNRGRYLLTFLMGKENVRLKALNSGRAPVLNAHDSWAMGSQIGVIESAELRDGAGFAKLRYFRDDAAADEIWNKVKQGARNVSMGAYIHVMREAEGSDENATPRRFEAVDWEPVEVSNVPIGADPDANIQMKLSQSDQEFIEVAVLRAEAQKEATMPENGMPAGQARKEELTAVITEQELARAKDQAARDARLAERERRTTILGFTKPFQLSAEFTEQLINSDRTVEECRATVLNELARQSDEHPISPVNPSVTITRDERDTRIQLASEAVLSLINPAKNKVDRENRFAGMRVSRIAEELLTAAGKSVRGMVPTEIAQLSMQNTADFPYVLENSARKTLQKAYQYATPTYKVWAKQSTAPDFKTMSKPRLGETPPFLVVPEGGQITIATMAESREQYAIATYGRGVSFTRQMLINDDLSAFNGIIGAFGVQAARVENATVYAILTANAAMADGTALFHADHSNLGTGVIANTALDAMFTSFATQKGVDGATILNLTPKYLIVPAAKAATASTAMTAVGPSVKIADQNWFAGRLEVVSDGVLDATSTAVWYAACDPEVSPGVEYSHLEGASGPQIIREENVSGILGVQLYAYLDFGAKALDWRPLYKSSGA